MAPEPPHQRLGQAEKQPISRSAPYVAKPTSDYASSDPSIL